MRRAISRCLAVLLLPVLLVAQQATGALKVYFLNVGQGDAIYIECPEPAHHNMLIDAGDTRYPGSSKLFQDQLREILGERARIDVVVSSHPHADHIGSMLWVLSTFTVGTYLDDGMAPGSAISKKLNEHAAALARHGNLRFRRATDLANLSKEPDFCPAVNVDAVLLKPERFGEDDNPNNNSVVILLSYNDQKFLLSGDAEGEEEALLLKDARTRVHLQAAVLKAPHHGSDTSSSMDFLGAVNPQIIVVSAGEKDVGTNKSYKHPRAETINRFLAFAQANGSNDLRVVDAYDTETRRWTTVQINAGVYVTSVDGTVILASDGRQVWKERAEGLASDAKPVRYVFSKTSPIYHFEECSVARQIKAENRVISKEPPEDKELHRGCPR